MIPDEPTLARREEGKWALMNGIMPQRPTRRRHTSLLRCGTRPSTCSRVKQTRNRCSRFVDRRSAESRYVSHRIDAKVAVTRTSRTTTFTLPLPTPAVFSRVGTSPFGAHAETVTTRGSEFPLTAPARPAGATPALSIKTRNGTGDPQ